MFILLSLVQPSVTFMVGEKGFGNTILTIQNAVLPLFFQNLYCDAKLQYVGPRGLYKLWMIVI